MRLRPLLVTGIALLTATPCLAERVTLTNGDRLTGSIVKSDDKTLTLKAALAGTVEIAWSAIKELVSDQPLVVTISSNPQPYVGTVDAKDGYLTVTPANGKAEIIPQASITSLRTPADQEAYEKSLHPPLTKGWNGGLNLGFALTGGNSETTNLALAFKAARPTTNDKLSLYANSVYAANNAPGANPSTSANNIQGGLRYDRNLTARLFGFVNGDFQSDQLQELDLRSVFGGGLGFHTVKNERTTLDLLGGANYTHESYTALSRNFAALTVGDEFTHKLGAGTTLTQQFFFYPNMNDFGEYRTTFDLGTVTKLNKWLAWQNAFNDIYVTNPPLGKKKNDITFTTGINFTFTH